MLLGLWGGVLKQLLLLDRVICFGTKLFFFAATDIDTSSGSMAMIFLAAITSYLLPSTLLFICMEMTSCPLL